MKTQSKAIRGCALFSTAIGLCSIAWRDNAIMGLALPESNSRATLIKLRSRIGTTPKRVPPQWVITIINQVKQQLRGKPSDFSRVTVALDRLTPFARRVSQAARRVAPGTTATYGKLAAMAGSPGAARAVGRVMARNPFPIIIPCHRVLASNGGLRGFSAFGGIKTKALLLAIEGVKLR